MLQRRPVSPRTDTLLPSSTLFRSILALLLLTAQLCLGAFTAGLRAGYAFNTWPLMGDGLFPQGVLLLEPFWRNVVDNPIVRSEEHTSELQSLMRMQYAVFCLKKKNIPYRKPGSTISLNSNYI